MICSSKFSTAICSTSNGTHAKHIRNQPGACAWQISPGVNSTRLHVTNFSCTTLSSSNDVIRNTELKFAKTNMPAVEGMK